MVTVHVLARIVQASQQSTAENSKTLTPGAYTYYRTVLVDCPTVPCLLYKCKLIPYGTPRIYTRTSTVRYLRYVPNYLVFSTFQLFQIAGSALSSTAALIWCVRVVSAALLLLYSTGTSTIQPSTSIRVTTSMEVMTLRVPIQPSGIAVQYEY